MNYHPLFHSIPVAFYCLYALFYEIYKSFRNIDPQME